MYVFYNHTQNIVNMKSIDSNTRIVIFEKHELRYFVIVSKHIIAYKKQNTIKIKAYLFVFHVSQNNIIFRNKHLEKNKRKR